MHYHHRDSQSLAPLISCYLTTIPPFECPATTSANWPLKNVRPCSRRGHEAQASLEKRRSVRASSRRLLLFQRAAKHPLNHARVARFARPAARGTLFAGLVALLWIASPQARSQTIGWPFTASNEVYSSPAIGVDGTVYFGSSDGRFYAAQSNGALSWSFTAGGGVISAPVLAADETVYFGSLDGALYAVSASGDLRWRLKTGSPIHSSPAVG